MKEFKCGSTMHNVGNLESSNMTLYYWASEASPTLGCSIEISSDFIFLCVCLSWSKKRWRNYMGQMRAYSKSVLGGKIRTVTPVLFISTILQSSFSMDGRKTFT